MPMVQDPDRDYRPPLWRPEKDAARAKLAADIDDYLKRGGKVEQLSHGATSNPLLARDMKWSHERQSITGGAVDKTPRRLVRRKR